MRYPLRIPLAALLLTAAPLVRAAEPPVPPPPALAATAWILVDQASLEALGVELREKLSRLEREIHEHAIPRRMATGAAAGS